MQDKTIIQRQIVNVLEKVAGFEYFGTIATNENYVHEKMKSRLNSANACCLSRHPSENLKIYKTMFLPVALFMWM
jgi:hypothetical protein